MTLDDILKGIDVLEIRGNRKCDIINFHFDSRLISENDMFIAINGVTQDGNEYINSAIEKGASVIVCNKIPQLTNDKVTYVLSKNTRKALSKISCNFYANPSKKIKLIGVTGTNGKTSVVNLLHQLFSNLGEKSGLISTVGNMIGDKKITSTHTTPDPKQLNFLINKMVEEKCSYCFMEVSSHAIDQERISDLNFDIAVFTNITHDHLDYHKKFENYLNTKKLFFDSLDSTSIALVNKDDKRNDYILQNSSAIKYTFSLKSFSNYKCKIIESDFDGMLLEIDNSKLWVKLTGRFNAYNLLAIYSVAILLNKDKIEVLNKMSLLSPAEGRFQTFKSSDNIVFVLDYAHTDDALQNVISTINSIRKKDQNLITVFGCGGDRDKLKRPIMTQIACKLSSRVILTSDNPRSEKIDDIISDMLFDISKVDHAQTIVINDREQAIKTAYSIAQSSDIILVAGKGHEKYQEVNGERIPFDDKEKILELINLNIN